MDVELGGEEMTCEKLVSGKAVVFVCHGGKRDKRCGCGNVATYLCDYPLGGKKAGTTCGRALCERCKKSQPVTINKDYYKYYCEAHNNLVNGVGK